MTAPRLATSLGEDNPLRYRGYIYDQETQLYYLQSRYYNPHLGRFINADALVATGQGMLGNNMFAYCQNCPVAFTDRSGTRIDYERVLQTSSGVGSGAFLTNGTSSTNSMYFVEAIAGLFTVITGYVARSVSTKAKEDERAQAVSITKNDNNNYQYWEATRVKNMIVIGRGLTIFEASIRVAMGLDVMCANMGAALWLLILNGYWNAVGPEIHGEEGYYWHFHPNRHSHTHIWYKEG